MLPNRTRRPLTLVPVLKETVRLFKETRVLTALGVVAAFSASCAGSSSPSSGDGKASVGGASSSGGGGAASGGQNTGASLSGGAGPSDGGNTAAGGTFVSQVPRQTVEYISSDEILRNPERGFYRATSILDEDTLSWIDDSYSLYFSYVRLDDYRDMALPESLLAEISEGLQKVRAEGAKLVLRFAYNEGPYPDSEPDASLDHTLGHIEQLGPLLRANEDVIATLQAGFIGAWGEWHTSTNGLANLTDKKKVLDALLEELPTSRTVQLRYPPDLMAFYPDPLTQEAAFDAGPQSRTGHHNDCFVASENDVGTYPSDPEPFKTYLAQNNLFVPMGGETCAVSPPRSECATALEEMQRLRFTFINDDYHPDVIASWENGGCKDDMQRSLGYRLELVAWDAPVAIAPGKTFQTKLTLKNVGFAAPMNPRPVFILLEAGGQTFEARLDEFEVRSWLPGQETTVEAILEAPEGLLAGEATLSLWLPDEAESIRNDVRYAIRTANQGTWDESIGANILGTVAIDPAAEVDDFAAPYVFTLR